MRLTIETPTYKRKITIEVDGDGLEISQVVEDLIEPALLGLLYHPDSVRAALYGEESN